MSNYKDQLTGLYAITDENLIPEKHFSRTIESALQGGARIIQYRDKSNDQQKRFQQATVLRLLCKQYRSICIINDDIELAKAVNADGVHLGKDDCSLIAAREALGEAAVIGVSCYNDLTLAISAQNNSADYAAFGAMFASATKPDAPVAGPGIIPQAKQQLAIPVCTIGGITQSNIQQLIQHGADMTAVISEIFSASDVKESTQNLNQHFA